MLWTKRDVYVYQFKQSCYCLKKVAYNTIFKRINFYYKNVREEGNDQELMQLSTKIDPLRNMGK